MCEVGVSEIAIYIPAYYISHEDLAKARDIPKDKFHLGLGNYNMSIIPNWEDTVTMAANAALQLLEKSGTDPDEIQQLVVSTESGVDYSKAVASYVQELLNIGTRCRVYEIKHACYGGTAGLVNSVDRISRNTKSTGKAIVIMTDIARYGFETPGEPTQGAGAVALLVERNPELFSIDTTLNGIFSKNVFDFWRPSGHSVPIVNGKYSIECYMMALEATIKHLRCNLELKDDEKLLDHLDYVVYHMPYCKMALKAHKQLIEIEYPDIDEKAKEALFKETYNAQVKPSTLGAKEVGNIYTGSVYMGLTSLLEVEKERVTGKKVGIFSYGSGCGAEFIVCKFNSKMASKIKELNFQKQMHRRKKISIEHYTHIYSQKEQDFVFFTEEVQNFKDDFTKFVFIGIKDHKRKYA